MQKEAEMGSRVLQTSLSSCLRHQCQQWVGKEGGKSFSSDFQFCLNSLVPCRYFVVVSQLCIYNYTVSLSNINEPVRASFLNYGSRCLPCLILFNSHHGYCKQGILPYAINIRSALIKKIQSWEWKHLFNLTSLEVNTFRLGPKLL